MGDGYLRKSGKMSKTAWSKRETRSNLTGPSRGRTAHEGLLDLGISQPPYNLRYFERVLRWALKVWAAELTRLGGACWRSVAAGSRRRDITLVTCHFSGIVEPCEFSQAIAPRPSFEKLLMI